MNFKNWLFESADFANLDSMIKGDTPPPILADWLEDQDYSDKEVLNSLRSGNPKPIYGMARKAYVGHGRILDIDWSLNHTTKSIKWSIVSNYVHYDSYVFSYSTHGKVFSHKATGGTLSDLDMPKWGGLLDTVNSVPEYAFNRDLLLGCGLILYSQGGRSEA